VKQHILTKTGKASSPISVAIGYKSAFCGFLIPAIRNEFLKPDLKARSCWKGKQSMFIAVFSCNPFTRLTK
jgi:hypothetical protein